eukprot:gene11132-12410_t
METMDDNVWNLLLDREVMFWNDVQISAGNVRSYMLAFSHFVQTPAEVDRPVGVLTIELSKMARYEAIAVIAYVLNQKLKLKSSRN